MQARPLILAVLTALGSVTVAACTAEGPPEEVRPDDLSRDFDRLVELVEHTHPDPYTAFGGSETFRNRVARFRGQARELRTVGELHTLAQRFLVTLNDGHTSMDPLPLPGRGRERRGPLRFGIAADGLFVRGAVPGMREYVGARVLAVNDLELDEVVDSVRIHYPAENRFGGMERLTRLLALEAGPRVTFLELDTLDLTVRTVTGDTVTLGLRFGEGRPAVERRPSGLDLTGDNPLLWGRVIERGERPVGYFAWTAVVSREVAEEAYRRDPVGADGTFDWVFGYLPDVARTGDPEQDLALAPPLYERFAALLHDMETRGAEHLIVDLRDNAGGMTPLVFTLLYMLYGDALLESDVEARYDVRLSELYLAKNGMAGIAEYNRRYGTAYALGDFRRGFLFRNDLSSPLEERRKNEDLRFAGFGTRYWEASGADGPSPPAVVVLTSPTTFSAAFHFTWLLSEIGSAVVVGVPPRQAPNAFMESTPFELPHSGLRGDISNAVQILYPDDDPRARVFTPDVSMTWEHFRQYDFDPNAEVLFSLDLIESGRILPGRSGA